MRQSNSVEKSVFPQRILVTGGTGFIGRTLVAHLLELGCQVTVYTRSAERARRAQPGPVQWLEDLEQLSASARFDALINLAGESLAEGRWTSRKKARLFASRLDATHRLLDWVQRADTKPQYLLNASAVGAYGPGDTRPLDESDTKLRPSFGQALCAAWEAAADGFTAEGVSVCKLRLGVVFARDGGAFAQLRRPFDFKVAVLMGDGKPYCSWIHRDDLVRAIEFLLEHQPPVVGVVNMTAPVALTYADLAGQLAAARHPWVTLSIPAPLLRLMLGEMAQELLLSGQNVKPARLEALGFEFRYPDFARALPDLLL